MGKKKHRPKTKAELLQAQWERERPRPPRPAAGWTQQAIARANRAQAAIARKAENEAFTISAGGLDATPALLPDAGREGPAIGGK